MNEDNKIEAILEGMGDLPTLPGIAMKILEVVKKDESNLQEIGEVLSMDPPLSAKVLQMINSPFYGLPREITSVPHAVNLLGIDTVKNLALSFTLVRSFQAEKQNGFDYEAFWKNSLTSAVFTKLVAKKILPAAAEEAFFLGLIHNIGILALFQCMPDQYNLVLREKERNLTSHIEAENQILGLDHAEVSAYLVEAWGLPDSFSVPIRHHHLPEDYNRENQEFAVLAQILHLSSIFVDFLNLPDKTVLLGLYESYARQYAILEEMPPEEITEQIEAQTRNVFPLFEIKMQAEMNYLEMMELARKELINLSTDFLKRSLEQKRLIESLRKQATYDGLTGLLNYQKFHEFLDNEYYRASRYHLPLSLILADIDDFKIVNDTYGHLAGDEVLKAIATSLNDCFRESDRIVRYGGEEFAVILPETPFEGGMIAAERLRRCVEGLSIAYEGADLCVTLSVGVASLTDQGGMDKMDLIKGADMALYQAKKTGKNRCCLFRGQDTQIPQRAVKQG
jgi:diguanylate cyclase (GGDEF)-like protein